MSRTTRSCWILKEANKPGETRCTKSWDRFEAYDSLYATSSKYPGKERTIAWKNTSQNSSSAKSPRFEILRTGPKKRLKDNSDAPEARHGTLPNTYTSSKRKTKSTFYSPAEEWVLPAASTKEPEERELVVDSGASMHMVSKKDLNSAELETMRVSRNPTTVMTANGEVQTREEATVYVEDLASQHHISAHPLRKILTQ